MEVKDNRGKSSDQIKRLATSKAAPVNSERDAYFKVLRKKKSRTGILMDRKNKGKNTRKHNDSQN